MDSRRAAGRTPTLVIPRRSTWREVPQATFLAWTDAQQRAYCAARDRDAARFADTSQERAWFLTRAEAYDRSPVVHLVRRRK